MNDRKQIRDVFSRIDDRKDMRKMSNIVENLIRLSHITINHITPLLFLSSL